MVTVRKPHGIVLTVSSWAAWRSLHGTHSIVPCWACDAQGAQFWLIEGGELVEDRWFQTACRTCHGRGSV